MPKHLATKPAAKIELADKPKHSHHGSPSTLGAPLKKTGLGCLIGSIVILLLQVRAGGPADALLSVVFYCFLVSLAILWAVWWIGDAKDGDSFSWKPLGLMALGSVAGGIFLEAGTLFGSPFHSVLVLQDWSLKQTLLWMCVAFLLLTLILSLKKGCSCRWQAVKNALGKAILPLGAISLAGAALGGLLLQQLLSIPFIYLFGFFFFAIAMVLFLIYAYRQNASVEWFFLIVALCTGLSMSFLVPRQTYVSWDDETHYDRTVAASYLLNPAYDQANTLLATNHVALGLPQPRDAVSDSLDALSNQDAIEVPGFQTIRLKSTLRYDAIAYIPAALGLWIGRFFHLSASTDILFSHLASILFYALICFFAIRLTPIKKVLMSCVALLPTGLFLANSFSADPFIISMSLLSMALILKQTIAPSDRSWWPFIAIFATMLMACAPKAVYFPLICFVFLIPAGHFPTKKAFRWLLRGLIVILALGCLGLVALALTTQGDTRGGSDVSIQGQLQFVLSNPLEYSGILFQFLSSTYLNPATSFGYSLFFAYLGDYTQISGFFAALVPLVILTVACMDSDRLSQTLANGKVRLFAFAVVMVTIVLIATSLYLAFTPIGNGTISGCQPRYLLPVLFPATALCFNWRLTNDMQTRTFACATTAFMGVLGFIGIWLLVLPMGL